MAELEIPLVLENDVNVEKADAYTKELEDVSMDFIFCLVKQKGIFGYVNSVAAPETYTRIFIKVLMYTQIIQSTVNRKTKFYLLNYSQKTRKVQKTKPPMFLPSLRCHFS